MYVFTHHVKLKFIGRLNHSFTFDIRYTDDEMYDTSLPNADLAKIFKVKEDGYLYINGYRITNNKDGIRAIYGSLHAATPEQGYVDLTLAIDSYGSVVKVKCTHTQNKAERILNKLFG